MDISELADRYRCNKKTTRPGGNTTKHNSDVSLIAAEGFSMHDQAREHRDSKA
jgi:hypothetical protein